MRTGHRARHPRVRLLEAAEPVDSTGDDGVGGADGCHRALQLADGVRVSVPAPNDLHLHAGDCTPRSRRGLLSAVLDGMLRATALSDLPKSEAGRHAGWRDHLALSDRREAGRRRPGCGPGPGGKWQISTEGGTEPLWNRNGRELFYRSGNKMMAVQVTTQPAFAASKPTLLFDKEYAASEFPATGRAGERGAWRSIRAATAVPADVGRGIR